MKRNVWIDEIKGFAIVLVVLGHIIIHTMGNDLEYYI